MRLDHLENAMHNVRHDELINGIMMRLDHINTDLEHMRQSTDEKLEESRKLDQFKERVC
jgi:hypothetical protein